MNRGIAASGVRVELGGRAVLDAVDLRVETHELVGLVGPNGSGKSTLLRTLYRALRPDAGHVLLDGRDVAELSPLDLARRLGVMLQERPTDIDLSVEDVVLLGRAAHRPTWSRVDDHDCDVVADALAHVGCSHLVDRTLATLSGGELQRVVLARALAQQPRYLVLDEPTNHLDVHHQLELLDLVRRLRITVITALHDLNLAASVCDRIVMLEEGRVRAVGPPTDVLTPTMVREVFGVHADVVRNPTSGAPQLLYSRLRAHEPLASHSSGQAAS